MKNTRKNILLLVLALLMIPCYALASSAPAAKKSNNKKKFIVVIDAGHGGKDIGASENGEREKDINLAVAQKVSKLLKDKMKNEVEVILTRDKDVFLSLQKRADIANNAKADLFISIHTNSVDANNPNRATVSGASVYTLGTDKDDKNQSIVRKENAIISADGSKVTYRDFDPESDESYIVFEMYQKNNMANSIAVANYIQHELVNTAGRKDRGTHQAGFWVLWATSMPSALVELDFICNHNEAKYLGSSKGQDKMAEAIYKGINSYYKNEYKRQLAEKDKKTEAETTDDGDFKAQVVLSTSKNVRVVSKAPSTAGKSANNNAPRKRRNNAARRASSQRNVEVASVYQPEVPEEKPIPEPVMSAEYTSTFNSETVAANTNHQSSRATRRQNSIAQQQSGANVSAQDQTQQTANVVNKTNDKPTQNDKRTQSQQNQSDLASVQTTKPQSEAQTTQKRIERSQAQQEQTRRNDMAMEQRRQKETADAQAKIQNMQAQNETKNNHKSIARNNRTANSRATTTDKSKTEVTMASRQTTTKPSDSAVTNTKNNAQNSDSKPVAKKNNQQPQNTSKEVAKKQPTTTTVASAQTKEVKNNNKTTAKQNTTVASVQTKEVKNNQVAAKSNNAAPKSTTTASTTKKTNSETKTKPAARNNTYYSIQLFESDNKPEGNVKVDKVDEQVLILPTQNGKYSYIVGHYTERNDSVPTLNKVQQQYPQAKIVAVNANNRKVIRTL